MNPEIRRPVFNTIDEVGFETPEGGAVVYGYLLVVEWMSPSGERWLTEVSSGPTGDKELPPWQVEGYASYLLNNWEDEDVEAEEEDDDL